MDQSVENFCNLLTHSRLLSGEEVRQLVQRWRAEAGGDGTDGNAFSAWLVANNHLTDFQADQLARGHADHFFFDHYKLLDRIGRGRMAGVYKAAHQLGQVVAIKVLPPSRARDPQSLARFQREARLAMRLKHPNVVHTFHAGQNNGLYFLVMEHLEGETLDEVLKRRGRLPPVEAVRLAYQAFQGLQHIHEQGMVHRDLEPGNLMLVPAAPPGQPDTTLQATLKILDIGMGRALFDEGGPEAGTPQVELTTAGILLGPPDYMAPEQARDAHRSDIRADIYSMGCVLYHCLAGQPPFPERNPVRQVMRHATEIARPLTEFQPDVPEVLQEIISAMMAKDPAQRYSTPDQAGRALRVVLHSEGQTPRLTIPVERSPDYMKWVEAQAPDETMPEGRAAPARPAALVDQPAVAPEPVRAPAAARPMEAIEGPLHLSRRDCVMIGLGACGVLAAEGAGWLIARLLRRRDRDRSASN